MRSARTYAVSMLSALLLVGVCTSAATVVAARPAAADGCGVRTISLCRSEVTTESNAALIGSSVTITVIAVDGNGNGQGDQCIALLADPPTNNTFGGDPNPTTTPDNGHLHFTVSNSVVGPVTYTAIYQGSSNANNCPPPPFSGPRLDEAIRQTVTVNWVAGSEALFSTVAASPATVVADGSSSATVTVVLSDANSDPLPNRPVSLSSPTVGSQAHIIPATANTGAGGQAFFTVTDSTAQSVSFQATDNSNGVTIAHDQPARVTFVPAAQEEAADSTVVASQGRVPADSVSTSTIIVTLADSSGPLAGRHISVTPRVSPGGGTGSSVIAVQSDTTNAAGQASFTVTDGTVEAISYTARDDQTGAVLGSVTVRFGDPTDGEQALSALALNPSGAPQTEVTVAGDGSTAAAVFVQLACFDTTNPSCNGVGARRYSPNQGVPTQTVSGAQVALVATGSSNAIVTGVLNPTNFDGLARFQVTDTRPEVVTFNAVDVTNNVMLAKVDDTSTPPSVTPLRVTITFTGAGTPSPTTSSAVASPTSVPADGATRSTITVTLRDANGVVAPGRSVNLSPSSGHATVSPSSASTNFRGVATFTTVNTRVETVSYLVTDTTDSVALTSFPRVSFTAGPSSASASIVAASPSSVAADGTSPATVTVTLTDGFANPIRGKTITLAQGPGGSAQIGPASGPTDDRGVSTFVVTDTSAEAVTFTATDVTDTIVLARTATVTFTGAPTTANSTMSADPSSVPADSLAASTITVSLRDRNNFPVAGKTVALRAGSGASTVSGAGPGSDTTDQTGAARFVVSDGTTETVTYAATDVSDGIALSASATVTFTGAPSGSASSVVANPSNVAADGTTASVITVTLVDGSGHPIPGHVIAVSQGAGTTSIIVPAAPGSATTNSSGLASFKVTDTRVETVTYFATDTSVHPGQTLFSTDQVSFAPPSEGANSSVVANPTSVPADGNHPATITVTLRDRNRNAIAGHSVALTAGAGSSSSINPTAPGSATTTAAGVATFAVTDATAEDVTFTATDSTANPTVVIDQVASVSFVALPSEASLSTLVAVPNAVPADGTSAVRVTVTLKDGAGNPIVLHTVVLTASGAAVVGAVSANTDSSGAATFSVTDTTVQASTLSATDVTANPDVAVTQQAAVNFTLPSDEATASSVSASPPSVLANGTDTSFIVVSLVAHGQPLAGDQVTLLARNGISVISTLTNPTGADGRAVFKVADTTAETVTYAATDSTTGFVLNQTTQVAFTATTPGPPDPSAPSISAVTPAFGPPKGGTKVTVSGRNLARATAVHFGAKVVTKFSVNRAGTAITVTAPAGVGTVDITVTTPSGTSASVGADQFRYGPAVTSLRPATGSSRGGTTVVIIGTNLAGASAVHFGPNAVTRIYSNSATSITLVAPPGTGPVDITVTTAGGTSPVVSADRFTYT